MAEEQFTQEQAASMARRLQRAWELFQDAEKHVSKIDALAIALRERAVLDPDADPMVGLLAEVLTDLTASGGGLIELSDMLNPEV